MQTADFDFDLPSELIAQHPLAERGASRMLVLERGGGRCAHRAFGDLPEYVAPGDLVVLNDTRVFPARLEGRWQDTGGQVELLLLEPADAARWVCLCGSGRRLRAGLRASFAGGAIAGEILRRLDDGRAEVILQGDAPLAELLERHGRTPLPPYIARPPAGADAAAAEDRARYQTVYARRTGAVAAPTAGLHFTDAMLARLQAGGAAVAWVTLHVGPGTFQPLKAERVEDHPMHEERYEVPAETAAALAACRARGGCILAVGSTTVRTLETMAAGHGGAPAACAGRSRLFIHEPYAFRFTDRLLTNFHLPRSTLLVMVSALAGRERVLAAYREAVARRYRFFSYGDCMLIA